MAYKYVVKFVCGKQAKEVADVARGTYYTVINVLNPTPVSPGGPPGFSFKKKFALPGDEAEVQEPGRSEPEYEDVPLDEDHAVKIDCRNIFRHTDGLAPPPDPYPSFREGFVIIKSDRELAVAGVYTAEGSFGKVKTIHVENVKPISVQ